MDSPDTGRQGARDLASLLPFVAIFLLAPPIILIFAKPVLVAGMPLIAVYLFGVWAAVIVCAFLVARHLAREDRAASEGRAEEGGRR
jgi:hypothetical protein